MRQHRTINGTNRLFAPLALMLVLILAASACSTADEPTASGDAANPFGGGVPTSTVDGSGDEAEATEVSVVTAPVDTVALAAEVMAGGVVLEAHDMQVEASGVQMRVERISQRSNATFVRLAIVNGSEDDKEVPHHQVATLTLPDGTILDPIAAFPTRGVRLETGESSIVVLRIHRRRANSILRSASLGYSPTRSPTSSVSNSTT